MKESFWNADGCVILFIPACINAVVHRLTNRRAFLLVVHPSSFDEEKLVHDSFARHYSLSFPSTSLYNIINRARKRLSRGRERSLSVFCSRPSSYFSLDDRRDILWLASGEHLFSHLPFFSFFFFSPLSPPPLSAPLL